MKVFHIFLSFANVSVSYGYIVHTGRLRSGYDWGEVASEVT